MFLRKDIQNWSRFRQNHSSGRFNQDHRSIEALLRKPFGIGQSCEGAGVANNQAKHFDLADISHQLLKKLSTIGTLRTPTGEFIANKRQNRTHRPSVDSL